MPRRTVITLCGSSKHKELFDFINQELTLAGFVILSLGVFSGYSNDIDVKERASKKRDDLRLVHKQKIDMSDSILVVDKDGIVGKDTQDEIDYAMKTTKNIFYYSQHFDLLRTI